MEIHDSKVHWALDAGRNLQKDTQLQLWGKDSEQRLVGRLIERAISEGKEPLAYLPEVPWMPRWRLCRELAKYRIDEMT